jgi:hypothetical protein
LDLLHLSPVVQQYDDIGRDIIGSYRKHAGIICPAVHGRQGNEKGQYYQTISTFLKLIHYFLQPNRS